MSELLGIDDPVYNFNCIFHIDNNPSAHILQKGSFSKKDNTKYKKIRMYASLHNVMIKRYM